MPITIRHGEIVFNKASDEWALYALKDGDELAKVCKADLNNIYAFCITNEYEDYCRVFWYNPTTGLNEINHALTGTGGDLAISPHGSRLAWMIESYDDRVMHLVVADRGGNLKTIELRASEPGEMRWLTDQMVRFESELGVSFYDADGEDFMGEDQIPVGLGKAP